jgi:ankyrin repeat protein
MHSMNSKSIPKVCLLAASRDGDTFSVHQLLASGSDSNKCNAQGRTAVMEAALWGNLEIIKLLISNGANINKQDDLVGFSALMFAVSAGHVDIAKYLIKNGAKLDLKNNFGRTVLEEAYLSNSSTVPLLKRYLEMNGSMAYKSNMDYQRQEWSHSPVVA